MAEFPAEHRPYVVIKIDVFDAREGATPQEIGSMAWSDVQDWVANGYLPVVEVVTEDGSEDVDLEESD